ncbi:phage tail tape measure protein [Cronobacter turicensis]|uniref:phage tail tape measure protein n=1 Tax=Cronobacter turicensis TaxID=413502 RepID=UPI0011AD6351|nr:phage tail tape measure protein [Cronobacter turicensis]ELU8454285.1 phage tail tape measure protein [Cronobacter turicensis]EMA1790391.1 phage tail tape measure protein [Cronobacter turicensis]EMA1799367.1 phage tail tape measure protein [Cronobacter turicensis]EMA1847668.1 phage tail tape measure protein [Cronobacter turicensis]EMA1857913.1 phage tail tape measure protein [Cronobacter turicensis]
MATLRELIIKISANSQSFQSEISRASRMGSDYYKTMEQGGRRAAAATRETQHSLGELNAQLASVRSSAAGMAGAFAGAFATGQLIHYADTWNQLNGRLRLASSSAQDFTTAQQSLMSISQRTGTSFEANANLYSRIAQSLRDAGYASADVANVTETVATSLKLSGASTEEASSVITQLSQALGSGVLRGEEFNAIMESGGRLAKFLADGLNTTVGGLRNMANNGELTTDRIVPLLTNVAQLRKEFDTLPASISGSAQKVENAFMAWVGGANQAVGASSTLSGVLDGLAENIDSVANVAGALVGLGVARYFGNMTSSVTTATASLIANTAAEVGLAEAHLRGTQVSVATARQAVYRAQQARAAAAGIEAQIAAERQLAVAQSQLNTAVSARSSAAGRLTETASVMSRLGGGVLSLLGGWPGVIAASGIAMYGLYQHTQQVHKEAVAFASNLDEINARLKDLSSLGLRSTAADARSSIDAQKKDIADLDSQIARVKDSLTGLAQIQQSYNESPTTTWINTFMDQADITEKNISLTDQLNKLEYEREKAVSKLQQTQKLFNDASEQATQKAIQEAGAIATLKGAYDLLNRSMGVIPASRPASYAGPVISTSNATPQQTTALEKARRDNELASLSGFEKLHQQHVYEAQDLKLSGALYTQYIYNKDQAARKDEASAQAKKNETAATNAQNKAVRDATQTAEQYSRKIADLSVAVEVQKVRATQGEKAAELYAASHENGVKWSEEQRKSIEAGAVALAQWTQKADEAVRKQHEMADALKDLKDAGRRYRDESDLTSATSGMGNRQREQYRERQEVERVFDKTDKGAEAIAARQAALDALDKKYQQAKASELDWRAGVSAGLSDWMDNVSNIAGTVSQGITSTMDSALDNVSAMLVGNKASWKDWGLSVLQTISKVALQMAVVNAMGGGSSGSGIFGSLLGGIAGGVAGSASGGASAGTAIQSYGSSFQFNAKGGVYSSADLSSYSGSIVNTPTFFAFAKGAGVMGEAGPEAIMPLTRDANGKLGVKALGNSTQGGAGVSVSIGTINFTGGTGGAQGNTNAAGAVANQLTGAILDTINSQLRKPGTPLWNATQGKR